MDISIIDTRTLKIRGKKASLVIDPAPKMAKTNADAVIMLNDDPNIDASRVTDYRVVIKGAGEYEAGGIKISAQEATGEAGKGVVCKLNIDDTEIVLGRVSDVIKLDGKVDSSDIVILNTNSELSSSLIATLEPKMLIFYGAKNEENLKVLGKDGIMAVEKLSIAKDKLPDSLEVAILASS